MSRPKTGGRKAGIPNNDKKELKDLLATKHPNYNPVIALADIANDDSNDINIRLQAHKEVAKYIEPQLKSSELKSTSEVKQTVEFNGGFPSSPKHTANTER